MHLKLKTKIKLVYDWLAISDPLEKADCIFLVGGSSLLPAAKAADLYRKGYASKIFFDAKGGTFSNPEFMKKGGESIVFYQELLRLGVPEKDLYYKNEAMNTLEEVQIAVPLMQENGINPKSIILVDRPIHQRREYATFLKHFPEIKFINCPADEECDYSRDTIEWLTMETERLKKYADKGDLILQNMPLDISYAYKVLKSYL